MRSMKALEKTITAATPYVVLLVALAVGLEVATVAFTGRLDTSGPISTIAGAAESIQLCITSQVDRLDDAFCRALAQLEYACTRRFV